MIQNGAFTSPEEELEPIHSGKTKENYIKKKPNTANLAGNSHTGGSLSMVLSKAPVAFCQVPKYLPKERGPKGEGL